MVTMIRVIDSLKWKYLMAFVAVAWLVLGVAIVKSLTTDEPTRMDAATTNQSASLDSNLRTEISSLIQHAKAR
jgi:hypothetical protein